METKCSQLMTAHFFLEPYQGVASIVIDPNYCMDSISTALVGGISFLMKNFSSSYVHTIHPSQDL